MKFKKKAIVISAEQFLPTKDKIPEGVLKFGGVGWVIKTLEGPLNVTPGDWIITGVKGERYPIADEIFRETYDEVIDDA